MKVRAAIFDVYGTLLAVGAPPKQADALWQELFESMLNNPPSLSRTEFSRRTSQVIARLHAGARTSGIRWPEIVWPAVVLEVIPGLVRLSARKRAEFILRQMQISRSVKLMAGVAECLRRLNENGVLLGIASNAQAYTLCELDDALSAAGLNPSMFVPELRFWSFEHGFSKPDPHVFRILTTRLEVRGVRPGETLMVGDRFDNDMEPARAFGWQTWQVRSQTQGRAETVGDWRGLAAWLKAHA